jgi:hypothetical protein
MTTKGSSGLMYVFVTSVLVVLNYHLAAVEVNISVSAEPSLPAANMIRNSGFEEPVGGGNFWAASGFYNGKGEFKVVGDQSHSGKMSLCALGFSNDAKGHMFTQEFYVPTDIRMLLDFWVKADRELPSGGTVSLRYALDNKDIVTDGVDAQINPLVKVPDKWIQFSNPPKDISAKSVILFWQPHTRDAPRTYQSIGKNIITFPKDKFGNQDKVKVKLYILTAGIGCLWYDDIILKPLETKLKYTVKGSDITEIRACNSRKKVVEQKTFSNDWQGEYSGTVVVPVDDSYQFEVKTKSGEVKYAEYPGKTN